MRLMPWVIGLGLVVFVLLWSNLDGANRRDQDHLSEAELRGEFVPDPWHREHPALASLGAGVVVVLGGAILVTAFNAERRDRGTN